MTKSILPLTTELLKNRLTYNPDTGLFTRNVLSGGQMPGSIAGGFHHKGYIHIRVGGKKYQAHRLAWFYMTGEMVPQIDHKDGIRHNNRFENLRPATNAINAQNLRKNKSNKLGVLGVFFHKASKSFVASISLTTDGINKKKHIGCFDTIEKASQAYLNEKRKIHPGCMI